MHISMETNAFEFDLTGLGLFVMIMGREMYWEFGARPVFSRPRPAQLQSGT